MTSHPETTNLPSNRPPLSEDGIMAELYSQKISDVLTACSDRMKQNLEEAESAQSFLPVHRKLGDLESDIARVRWIRTKGSSLLLGAPSGHDGVYEKSGDICNLFEGISSGVKKACGNRPDAPWVSYADESEAKTGYRKLGRVVHDTFRFVEARVKDLETYVSQGSDLSSDGSGFEQGSDRVVNASSAHHKDQSPEACALRLDTLSSFFSDAVVKLAKAKDPVERACLSALVERLSVSVTKASPSQAEETAEVATQMNDLVTQMNQLHLGEWAKSRGRRPSTWLNNTPKGSDAQAGQVHSQLGDICWRLEGLSRALRQREVSE